MRLEIPAPTGTAFDVEYPIYFAGRKRPALGDL